MFNLIESQIANVNQLIRQKHEATSALRNKNNDYKQLTLQQAYFQNQLIATRDKHSSSTPLTKPLSIGSKRDLTGILTVTPKKICKKVEDLLRTQYANGEILPSEKLSCIEQLICRLPDPYNEQPFNELSQSLLTSLQSLNAELQLHNYTKNHGIDKKKEQYIGEFNSHREAKVENLSRTKQGLEEQCLEVEKALVQRVRELHGDQAVQSALT